MKPTGPPLKTHKPKDGLFTCPKCASYLSEDAVICIECGLNLRTNLSVPMANHPSGLNNMLYVVLTIGGLFVLVNILMLNKAPANLVNQQLTEHVDLFSQADLSEKPEAYVPPPPRPTSKKPTPKPKPVVKPAPRPEPMPEPPPTVATEPVIPVAQPEPQPEPIPEPAPVPEPEPEPELDLAAQKALVLTSITSDMNRTHPLLKSGRIETIYAKSGQMNGLINLISRGYLLITVNGKREQVYFNQLETRTRIRVDEDFRNKALEDMTYRKLVQMRMNKD